MTNRLYTIHCDLINYGKALRNGRKFSLPEAQKMIARLEMADAVIYRYYLREAR